MVRLVLFDIDGTLIRTHGVGVQAFARAFAAEFGVPDATDGIRFAGRTDVSLAREMFTNSRVEATAVNFRRFFASYVVWLGELMAASDGHTCPGVREFLRGLARLPEPPLLGLLTGNIRRGAEIKLRHFELWETFTTGAFADDHEDRNQIAVVARDRARQLLDGPLRGDEIVVVGDTPHDVHCGRAIGAKVLAVTTGGATPADLREHRPEWLVETLQEVTAEEVCRPSR